MYATAGFKNIRTYNHLDPGGSAVHEMGTVRMGKDPKTSALNNWNQLHDVKNVFITERILHDLLRLRQTPRFNAICALTARACTISQ